jgi:hypothetical protein
VGQGKEGGVNMIKEGEVKCLLLNVIWKNVNIIKTVYARKRKYV